MKEPRVVIVTWRDCTSMDVSMTPQEAGQESLLVMQSCGFLVAETPEVICIGRDSEGQQGTYRDLQWIPKVNIDRVQHCKVIRTTHVKKCR